MSCGCGCSGNSGGCQGNCGAVKIITEQGVKGDKGDTGDTGATGAPGADGADGLGYDNMSSSSSINITAAVPFTSNNFINPDKAPTTGTRLRYTRTGDLTMWVEGIVTSYTVGSGAISIDIDKKSSTATGVHNDWAVTVIGEPGEDGAGFEDIVNIGTGEGLYKGINGTDAEFRSILGAGALLNGITTVGDDVVVSPLTDDNEFEVWPGGTSITPSFSYSPGIGENLISPGSIGASKVKYYDWNNFIFLTFEVQIDNFYLTGPNNWSIDPYTFQVNGLPVSVVSGGDPETFMGGMSASPVENPVSDPDYVMNSTKPVQFVYNNGSIGVKSGGAFYPRVPTKNEPVKLFFYGQILIRKNN